MNPAAVKRTKDNYVTPHPHRTFFFFSFLPFVLPSSPPPSHIPFTKRPTSFYHCGFENRQGEKCLKVLGIQLFQSMNLGRSLKSVSPFIVPCGKICTAKVRRVRQPMTWRLWSARHRLTSERNCDPGQSLREAGRQKQRKEKARMRGECCNMMYSRISKKTVAT